MLRFFRSIRQNLLAENKTVKYLKYATGEFVLVVLGILVALQINNWNERRKESALLEGYIGQLIKDIKRDRTQNVTRMNQADARTDLSEFLIDCLDDPPLAENHPVKFIVALDAVSKIFMPVFNTDTFDELQSTGYMRLLDDDLKLPLLDYYGEEEVHSEISSRREFRSLEFEKLSYPILGPRQQLWIQEHFNTLIDIEALDNNAFPDFDNAWAKEVYSRLKANEPLCNWIPVIRRVQRGIERSCRSSVEDADQLIERLSMALNEFAE